MKEESREEEEEEEGKKVGTLDWTDSNIRFRSFLSLLSALLCYLPPFSLRSVGEALQSVSQLVITFGQILRFSSLTDFASLTCLEPKAAGRRRRRSGRVGCSSETGN